MNHYIQHLCISLRIFYFHPPESQSIAWVYVIQRLLVRFMFVYLQKGSKIPMSSVPFSSKQSYYTVWDKVLLSIVKLVSNNGIKPIWFTVLQCLLWWECILHWFWLLLHVFHLSILPTGQLFHDSISRYLLHSAKAFITELNGALPMTSKVTCTEFGLQEWIFRRKAPVPKGAMQIQRTQKKEHITMTGQHTSKNAITSLSYDNRIKNRVIVFPCNQSQP